MKFLFIGQGYPGVEAPNAGSGIGTYLREMCLGLTARGHECHVVVWRKEHGAKRMAQRAESMAKNPKKSEAPLTPCAMRHALCLLLAPCAMPSADAMLHAPCALRSCIDGVTIHPLAHSYWPVIERFAPDSRDVHNLRMLARKLNAEHGFDWIEIESEEGIALGVQRDFPDKTVLRIHTTLAQMVQYKDVPRSRVVRRRLAREVRSFREARRVVTHSRLHAEELRGWFPFLKHIDVVPHGIDVPCAGNPAGPVPGQSAVIPSFLIIGSADRRKGFDRIRPVLDAYAKRHGSCRLVIVSECAESTKAAFGLVPPWPSGVRVEWREKIGGETLAQEYRQASALLHLARYESFGLPLVEAAAFGAPVVATPVGIAPELLTGDLRRFLVDGDDAGAVAHALAVAEAEKGRIGAALRQRYERSYTRDCMVEHYLQALERVRFRQSDVGQDGGHVVSEGLR